MSPITLARVPRWSPILLLLFVTGCMYGPARTQVMFEDHLVQGASHTLTVAVDWAVVQVPKGIATFPNGGVPRVRHREARIYRIDLATRTAELIARLEDYGGVPVPKSIDLHDWQGDGIHFTIRGYGSTSWRSGDDLDDVRVAHFHLTESGDLVQEAQPPRNPITRDTEPATRPSLTARRTPAELLVQVRNDPDKRDRVVSIRIDETVGEFRFTELTLESD